VVCLPVECSSVAPVGALVVRLVVPLCSASVVRVARVVEVGGRRRGRCYRRVVVVELEVFPV
jgi:hypothetical protein